MSGGNRPAAGAGDGAASPARRRFLAALPLRALDLLAIGFAAGVTATVTRWVTRGGGGTPMARVTAPGASWLLPLSTDTAVEVPGPIGVNTVRVTDGTVAVVSAPCTNQICVKTGHVSRPGQWIACLPNRVFVSIESGTDADVDAYSF